MQKEGDNAVSCAPRQLGSCHPAVTSGQRVQARADRQSRHAGTKRYLCLAGLRLFSFDLEHIRALT